MPSTSEFEELIQHAEEILNEDDSEDEDLEDEEFCLEDDCATIEEDILSSDELEMVEEFEEVTIHTNDTGMTLESSSERIPKGERKVHFDRYFLEHDVMSLQEYSEKLTLHSFLHTN